ncbi:MAG TPA: diacylglycerol kinase family protein, partial [Bacteroidales bacterium]|nr:diacylglycerol kinase family protein [Bacteroidales bacterium]HOX76094.1 diacylglycerol kinase family protein [Bacteroidales bacterium]HQM70427.1 diacylglycerol kinase family protein [Bacteroidales bacterium]
MNSGRFTPRSRFRSFKFAFRGLRSLLIFEHNSRIHLAAAIIVVALGFILGISIAEWALLTLTIGLVFVSELINSSLEEISDVVKPEWNEKIMRAKDYAAAAV